MTDNMLKQASESQRTILRQHQAREKKRYFKAVLLLLLAVFAGVAIGVGGTVLYMRDKFRRRPPSPEAVADMVVGRMREAIPLKPEEETRLHGVIDEHMREVDAFRRANFDNFRAVMDRMNARIAEVVGPERNATWNNAKEKYFGKRAHPPKRNDHKNH